MVRLAYRAPHLDGAAGARWYQLHHALPRLLSRAMPVTVHAYVDPDEFEQVAATAAGRPVGGEVLRYSAVDFDAAGEGWTTSPSSGCARAGRWGTWPTSSG